MDTDNDEQGPVGTALTTSVRDNATAFGFSIMITASFAALNRNEGTPTVTELLLFGVAAAMAVALLEAGVTHGFRRRAGSAPAEVTMLGTALNALSVAVGVGTAVGIAEVASGLPAWAAGGFLAAMAYILTESAELLLAEGVQKVRGDPAADEEED